MVIVYAGAGRVGADQRRGSLKIARGHLQSRQDLAQRLDPLFGNNPVLELADDLIVFRSVHQDQHLAVNMEIAVRVLGDVVQARGIIFRVYKTIIFQACERVTCRG